MNIFTLSVRSARKMLAAMAVFALVFSPFANVEFVFAAPAANLDQAENGGVGDPVVSPVLWKNGNLNDNNSHYVEGESIPYRAVLTDLPVGTSITATIGYDIKNGGKHAIDYITHYDRIGEVVDPTAGVAGIVGGPSTFAIPAPSSAGSPVAGQPTASFNALTSGERVITAWNATITNVVYATQGNLTANSAEATINVTFTPSASTVVLAWGGHIGSRLDWGFDGATPRSAGGINGSSYHMRLDDWDCNDGQNNSTCDRDLGTLGNQDRSLSAGAVIPPAILTIVKNVVNDNGGAGVASDFSFSLNGGTATNFEADGSNQVSLPVDSVFSVVETAATGYTTSYEGCSGTITATGATCTITNNDIAPPAATLTLTKIVNNTAGGSATANQWTVKATGPETISGAGTVTDTVTPGTYTLSEEGTVARYQAGTWQCTDGTLVGNELTLVNGDSATCTITNTYVPAEKASITLVKTVINDNGGAAVASTFKYFVNGVTEIFSGVAAMFDAETPTQFTLTETNTTGYAPSVWGGNCAADGTVTLSEGQSANCTITNDDIAPSITIKKVVNNGTSETPMDPEDFDIVLTATDINGVEADDQKTFAGSAAGTTFTFDAGAYAVTEPSHPGYAMTLEGDCSGTAALNTTRECTVVNTYIEPTVSTVTFIKEVKNDNGGTATPEDFSFTVNGETIKTGESVLLGLGTFGITENGPTSGYEASYSVSCQGGSVTIEQSDLGKQRTCTVTNDDIAPELTIIKNVENDNKYKTGTAVASDFTLEVDATNPSQSSVTGSVDGATITLDAGAYAVTEPTPGDYKVSYSVDCSGTIALGEKKTCTVTNNDIDETEAVVTVKKFLTKLYGGLESVADFAFKINDGDAINFNETATSTGENVITLNAEGAYSITEVFAPRYDVSYQGCEFNAEFGASYTCEITNTELPECSDGIDNDGDRYVDFAGQDPSCTDPDDDSEAEQGGILIDKVVTGEGASESQVFSFTPAWTDSVLNVTATSAVAGWTNLAPGTYTVTETDIPARYTLEDISCVGTDGKPEGSAVRDDNAITVTLSVDEQVTCTFTNKHTPRDSNDNSETITVSKEVTAGSDTRTQFSFLLPWRDSAVMLGAGMSDTSGDLAADEVYTISEVDLPLGWSLDELVCTSDDYESVSYGKSREALLRGSASVSIYLRDGENVDCVFVNDQERFVLEGYVWDDEDEDGVYDEDESPLEGWTVRTTDGTDTLETLSDASGYYSFNVPRGTWTISEDVQGGWDQTFPFETDEFVHVVTVPMEEEEEYYEEENYLSMIKSFFVATAHAGLVGTYGPYNFGNDRDTSGGGGRRIPRDTDSDPTPTPQVLGEQVSVVPLGAADAGQGGAAPVAIPTNRLMVAAFVGRSRNNA